MNKHRMIHLGLKNWTFSLLLALLAFGPFEESAQARRHRIVLSDGVEVVFDITEQEATITLRGTSKNSYQIEGSEDLSHWVVLRNRALLENSGTFTYVDNRGLPKCFYRIVINKSSSTAP
jgi:hypothetical protein